MSKSLRKPLCKSDCKALAAMLAGAFALISLTGCTSGRQLALRNPFESPAPAYKSQYGLTPAQKVDRLRALTDEIATMDSARQSRVCEELIATFKKENDPLLRRELVRTIGSVGLPQAEEGLHLAAQDSNERVRIAACEAWGRRNDPQAAGSLAAILAEDEDVDVRLAASEALARHPQGESLAHLAATLEDRNPAVQLATMNALRDATGAGIGHDVNEWLAYLNSQSTTSQPAMDSLPTGLPSEESSPFPQYPSAEAQLASGVESSSKAKPPVYEDVSSGQSIFR